MSEQIKEKSCVEIITDYLKTIGADGLCTDGCGCDIENLVACGEDFSKCTPAKEILVDEDNDYLVDEQPYGRIMIPLYKWEQTKGKESK